MIYMHSVLECTVCESIRDAGVLSRLVPGIHPYHILVQVCQLYLIANGSEA